MLANLHICFLPGLDTCTCTHSPFLINIINLQYLRKNNKCINGILLLFPFWGIVMYLKYVYFVKIVKLKKNFGQQSCPRFVENVNV